MLLTFNFTSATKRWCTLVSNVRPHCATCAITSTASLAQQEASPTCPAHASFGTRLQQRLTDFPMKASLL